MDSAKEVLRLREVPSTPASRPGWCRRISDGRRPGRIARSACLQLASHPVQRSNQPWAASRLRSRASSTRTRFPRRRGSVRWWCPASRRPPIQGRGTSPTPLEEQIDNLFTHVGQMLEGAGATWDDMAKMTFYVTDPAASRPALNGPWVERFPRSGLATVSVQHEGGRQRARQDLLRLRGLHRRLSRGIRACSADGLRLAIRTGAS